MADGETSGPSFLAPETTGTKTSVAVAEIRSAIVEDNGRMPADTKQARVEYGGEDAGDSSKMCEVCKKVFTKNSSLRKHRLIHTGGRPHQCPACCMKFKRKQHLDDHWRTHTGEKPYKCHLCPNNFNHKSSLDEHLMAHAGKKPHQCPLCARRFSRKYHLNRHIGTLGCKK
ncbi:hypothetical protein HPB49_001194 [Dermacentor silvarum]|uniref:Uncharacterized protein n=1 Tax=Dermacentor silvarum TaxID=543639 RepID=A0ACB8DI29_DERSI|nr:hypothetical protein HPB49_001194 [Dermacentor silvarum]